MQRGILKFEEVAGNGRTSSYRTIFKTQHGRIVFLALEADGAVSTITDCYYLDRNQKRIGETPCRPKKLKTFQFPTEDLLSIVQNELDKYFYGVEYACTETAKLSTEEYINAWSEASDQKYRFLIMVGDGIECHGLPCLLRTRLKNRLHRSIYIELAYYKDGSGVVTRCHYYDRRYKRKDVRITPPMLVSCFFPYTKRGIIDLLNKELCCDFTHMLLTEEIDVETNQTPLCGSL